MDDFWNGALAPTFTKHYDNLHGHNVVAHLRDNYGIVPTVGERVKCDRDPITEEPLGRNLTYYIVRLLLSGVEYSFLIRADNKARLTDDYLNEQLMLYFKNPVPGGRDINYYIVAEESAEQGLLDLSSILS